MMKKNNYIGLIILLLLIIYCFLGCDIDTNNTTKNEIVEYFTKIRSELPIVATTVTENGQIVDWIPRDSQVD